MSNKRNDGVELLRCLLMFFIVLHHTYVHGLFGPDHRMMQMNAWWGILFTTFIAWHVDGFIAISGWFGIRFSWKKFLSLWGLMAFYGGVNILCSYLFGRPRFDLSAININGGWFGGSYLMLMLFAPFLNAAVKWLAQQGQRQLLSALILLVAGMFFAWFPRNAFTAIAPSGTYSHTFWGMVFVYLVARSLHELIIHQVSLSKLLLLGLLFPTGIVLCSYYGVAQMLSHHLPVTSSVMNSLSGYTAPHVWIFAIVLLMVFLWHVKVPAWLGLVCRFVGPSTFGIYLMHDVVVAGKCIYLIPERYMFEQLGQHPITCIVISAVITYIICLAIDCLRRLSILRLKPHILPILARLSMKHEETPAFAGVSSLGLHHTAISFVRLVVPISWVEAVSEASDQAS